MARYPAFRKSSRLYLSVINILTKNIAIQKIPISYVQNTQLTLICQYIIFIDNIFASSNHLFSFVSVRQTYTSLKVISDTANDIISIIVARVENETSTSTSSRRITTKAKLILDDYFDRYNFSSNKIIPRCNSRYQETLDDIIVRFNLKHTQVSCQ